MAPFRVVPALVLSLLVASSVRGAESVRGAGFVPPPPPPSPPIQWRPARAASPRQPGLAAPAPYSIGDPTDEEQLYVEFINRARADPAAEGRRLVSATDAQVQRALDFYQVDVALAASQFEAIAPAPPLSINAALTVASRQHTQDMFQNAYQDHVGSDGSSSADRVTAAGYEFTMLGENVFSYALSVWYGHAGFNVDWGDGPGGMQDPPGHRRAIHNPAFQEVGAGVVFGVNGNVGPQLVTQEFASRAGLSPFVTGVVYYDHNTNQFYDLGEGIGGVTVHVGGTAAFAVTSRSGGYSVPVPGNGTYLVTFEVPGLASVEKQVVVSNHANAKTDHAPPYSAPVLGGSSVAYVGRDNAFAFSPVGAATAYDWRWTVRIPWNAPEGAENGAGRFNAYVSPGYDLIATDVAYAGRASFHFAHPKPIQNQYLELQLPLRLQATSQLTFSSRLGWAAADQVARVQLSGDDGATWTDLWHQAGSNGPGETTFSRLQVPLGGVGGLTNRLRFAYTFESGSYFPQTNAGVGWYFDDIVLSDAEDLTSGTITRADPGHGFNFRPDHPGAYLLEVRPLIGDRVLEWGPALALIAENGEPVPPRIRLGALTREPGGPWALRFFVEQGPVASFEILGSSAVDGTWLTEGGAVIEATAESGAYRATFPAGAGPQRFYRVVGH